MNSFHWAVLDRLWPHDLLEHPCLHVRMLLCLFQSLRYTHRGSCRPLHCSLLKKWGVILRPPDKCVVCIWKSKLTDSGSFWIISVHFEACGAAAGDQLQPKRRKRRCNETWHSLAQQGQLGILWTGPVGLSSQTALNSSSGPRTDALSCFACFECVWVAYLYIYIIHMSTYGHRSKGPYIYKYTSSTAQGGGGSFKNRKRSVV